MRPDEIGARFAAVAAPGSDMATVARAAEFEAQRSPGHAELLVTRVVASRRRCAYEWVRDGVAGATVVDSAGPRDYGSDYGAVV